MSQVKIKHACHNKNMLKLLDTDVSDWGYDAIFDLIKNNYTGKCDLDMNIMFNKVIGWIKSKDQIDYKFYERIFSFVKDSQLIIDDKINLPNLFIELFNRVELGAHDIFDHFGINSVGFSVVIDRNWKVYQDPTMLGVLENKIIDNIKMNWGDYYILLRKLLELRTDFLGRLCKSGMSINAKTLDIIIERKAIVPPHFFSCESLTKIINKNDDDYVIRLLDVIPEEHLNLSYLTEIIYKIKLGNHVKQQCFDNKMLDYMATRQVIPDQTIMDYYCVHSNIFFIKKLNHEHNVPVDPDIFRSIIETYSKNCNIRAIGRKDRLNAIEEMLNTNIKLNPLHIYASKNCPQLLELMKTYRCPLDLCMYDKIINDGINFNNIDQYNLENISVSIDALEQYIKSDSVVSLIISEMKKFDNTKMIKSYPKICKYMSYENILKIENAVDIYKDDQNIAVCIDNAFENKKQSSHIIPHLINTFKSRMDKHMVTKIIDMCKNEHINNRHQILGAFVNAQIKLDLVQIYYLSDEWIKSALVHHINNKHKN